MHKMDESVKQIEQVNESLQQEISTLKSAISDKEEYIKQRD